MAFAILMWVIFGFVVGTIAKFIYPSNNGPQGALQTIGTGVAGSFLGGFVNSMMVGRLEVGPSGVIMSILGAVLFLFLYERFKTK